MTNLDLISASLSKAKHAITGHYRKAPLMESNPMLLGQMAMVISLLIYFCCCFCCSPDSFSDYLISNIAMITAMIKVTPFQKRTGSRSNSGARVLFRNALFGLRRSYKNSDNSS